MNQTTTEPAAADRLLTLEAWRERRGMGLAAFYSLLVDLTATDTGLVPALCTENCQVPADASCAHGCPSLLRELELV